MRCLIMSFSVVLMVFSQDLFASTKTDSIVAFLGGAHAKFVWKRFAWCKDDYTPKTQATAQADGYSLMFIDTKAGTERALFTGLNNASEIRISRSGKWVTFIDGKKSYIVDLTASTPVKNVLLDVAVTPAYYNANAWWIDPANGDEYVFATDFITDKGSTGIWKFKVNANGTAGPATKLTVNSSAYIVGPISVSADGKKLGAAFPWPNTYILDIPSGNLTSRHHDGESFGCQPNIAPDNSYRFYHCQGEHTGIYMFPGLTGTDWYVDLSINLAGVPTGSLYDFDAPRWTNHVQYFTSETPMGDNHRNVCSNPYGSSCYLQWNQTAAQVKTSSDIADLPRFFIGKFSADFKTQEKSLMIGFDPRHLNYGGDAWICSGITDGSPCSATASSSIIRAGNASAMRIQRTGSSVTIRTGSAEPSVIRISDARGRFVRTWSGAGTCVLDAQDLTAGTYLVSITAGQRNASIRLPVTAASR